MSACLPERRLPLEAEVISLMREVARLCRRPEFAEEHADLCARAIVVEIRACGAVVRRKYWVLVRPRPHPAVIKAAARFISKLPNIDGYVPYRLLVQKAAEEFVQLLKSRSS